MLATKFSQPYFGPYLACRRSWPQIYWYQQRLIKYAAHALPMMRMDILEIGSWAGASAYSWCEAISRYFGGAGEVTCVDLWDDASEFERQFKDDTYSIKDVFNHNISAAGFEGRVRAIQASSDQAFADLAGRQFDLVYIDGAHSYSQVCRDLVNAMELIGTGGILCGDDLEIQAEELEPAQLKAASEFEAGWAIDAASGNGYHPGVTRAVGENIGPVSNWGAFWAVANSGHGWELINLDGIEAEIPRPLVQYDNEGNKVFDF
jgi:predicted O-methyltransferase YrrM